MNFKKPVIIVYFFLFSVTLFSENFTVNKISFNTAIYKPPFSFSLDYVKRKNDFLVAFPILNLTLDTRTDFQILTAPVIKIKYKTFFCNLGFDYELFTPNCHQFSDDTVFCGNLTAGFVTAKGTVVLRSEYGKKRWLMSDESIKSEFEFTEAINLIYPIYDNLIIKSYCDSLLTIHILPDAGFSSYDFICNIPFQFNWYYGESCLLGSLFYTDRLDFFDENNNLKINRSYENLSGRISKSTSEAIERYKFWTSIEFEQRLYLLRLFSLNSNFFISSFCNFAIGYNSNEQLKNMYQFGLGIGYNMYGCVPFTFQFGLNEKRNIVLYLNAVSKIIF